MDTKRVRKLSIALLVKDRPTKADIREYVGAVEELADDYDAHASFQTAFDNSMKQLRFINEMTENMRKRNG